MTPDGIRQALREVDAGMLETGRDRDEFDVVLRVPIAVDEPTEVVRGLARRLLTGYAVAPTYTAALARQGYGEDTGPVVEAWKSGDRARAVSLFPDAMVDAFFVHGTAKECTTRLEAYGQAGVRTLILMHLSVAPTPEERAERIAAQLHALAPDASTRSPG